MINRSPFSLLGAVVYLFAAILTIASARAQGTRFTYQGRIQVNDGQVTGRFDFRFTLHKDAADSSLFAGPLTSNAVGVTNGLFTVVLDFGDVFDGTDLWLQIGVRTNGAGTFIILNPRQPITSAPHAAVALNAQRVVAGGVSTASLADGAVTAAKISNNAVTAAKLSTTSTATSGQFLAYNGASLAWPNLPAVPPAWGLAGNSNTVAGVHFIGTSDNQPLEARVNGNRVLRLEAPGNNGTVNLIAGSRANRAELSTFGVTISGGGSDAQPNVSLGYAGTIGGGYGNEVGAIGTVGGGVGNKAIGFLSAIGAGTANTNSGQLGFIGGGQVNYVGGVNGVIGGGQGNVASGGYSSIVGGRSNTAAGLYSSAGGRRAKALHEGAWVWADSLEADFSSTAKNQFLIRASGGVGINTAPEATLHVLSTNNTSGDNTARFYNPSLGADSSHIHYGATGDWYIRSAHNSGKVMLQDKGGNVGIGTASPAFTLEVNGTAGKPGGGDWSTASDERVKKNIRPLAGALRKLLALRGVTFEYVDPEKVRELSGERMGLIAQEVEKVFPDWVETGADGFKRVTVRGLAALMVEALRELRSEESAAIDDLNQRLRDELKERDGQIHELKGMVQALTQKVEKLSSR